MEKEQNETSWYIEKHGLLGDYPGQPLITNKKTSK